MIEAKFKAVEIAKATNTQLDWLVAKCQGISPIIKPCKYSPEHTLYPYVLATIPLEYCTNPTQAWPIIEREKIDCIADPNGKNVWMGRLYKNFIEYRQFGPTSLIAAMRCYVLSFYGTQLAVVPEELN